MTVIARRIASVPRCTSVETWQRIVELVSEPTSAARTKLENVTSVAATLIAEEYTKTAPITIAGGGPFLRLYTLHGDDAIESDLADEDEIAFDPTAGDSWLLSLPAAGPDVRAAESLLVGAAHVEVRDVEQVDQQGRVAAASTETVSGGLVIDLEELARP